MKKKMILTSITRIDCVILIQLDESWSLPNAQLFVVKVLCVIAALVYIFNQNVWTVHEIHINRTKWVLTAL